MAETVDPLGGSWCVEALTNGIERQAREYIARIDRMGGVIPAVDSGYIQKEIQDAAYRYQLQVERKEQVVVGVNDFVVQEGKPDNLLKVDPLGDGLACHTGERTCFFRALPSEEASR